MEKRDLYKQKYEAQLREWQAKLDGMKAQAEKLTVQAKLDMKPHLDAVTAKFDTAKARLNEVAGATNDKWDAVVKEVDHTWSDFKAAAQGAFDALKHHKKD